MTVSHKTPKRGKKVDTSTFAQLPYKMSVMLVSMLACWSFIISFIVSFVLHSLKHLSQRVGETRL